MALRRIGLLAAITIGLSVPAASASAQDDPKVGITMGYPASVGVFWQVNDRVALRPEFNVQKVSGESTSTIAISLSSVVPPLSSVVPGSVVSVTTSDSWQFSAGVSALFYLSTHDALRTYVSPRWAYTRTSNTNSSSTIPSLSLSTTASGQSFAGSFGAQYALGRRFGVFGEVGIVFSRSTVSPDGSALTSAIVTTSESVSKTLGVRSGAGVILYF
jgi:hypothetical protein